jgi:cysteine synthase A
MICSEQPVVARGQVLGSLIGHTPIVPLFFEPEGVTVYAKCEFLNPSGSIKDRFAWNVIEDAEARGVLKRDSIILECTSGNTGISLAMVGAAKGYRVTILMSESASLERRRLMAQYGAELILFAPGAGYQTGIDISRKMAAKDSRFFLPRQFENPLNAADHERMTGAEIVQAMPQGIDAFVAGYGTGGTLIGCGRAIRRAFPKACIVAMEPAEAAMLNGEMPCCHAIEGIAGGFMPPLLSTGKLDGEIAISSEEAMGMTRRLQRSFGLMVGTSSGGNVAAALRLARQMGPRSKVVTILCDRAERYFSTRLFDSAPAPVKN